MVEMSHLNTRIRQCCHDGTDDEGEQSVISDQHEQKTEKILNI